jgi:uncharacterized membrane protein YraQ (UPF0718 family)
MSYAAIKLEAVSLSGTVKIRRGKMTGVYIIAGLIVAGVAGYIFYKIKWGMSDRAENRSRSRSIEAERVAEAAANKKLK